MVAPGRVSALLLCSLLLTERINGTNYMFTMGGLYWGSRNSCTKTCNALSATCVAFKIDNDNPLEEATVTTTLLQELTFRILKWPCQNEGSPDSADAKTTKDYNPYVVRRNLQNCYGWNSNAIKTSCEARGVENGFRLCLCRKEDAFATETGIDQQRQCLAPIPVKVPTPDKLQSSYCRPIDAHLLSFDDPKGYNFVARAGKHFPDESIWAGGRIKNDRLINFWTYQYADNSSYYGKYNGVVPPTDRDALLDTTSSDLSYTTGGNYAGHIDVQNPDEWCAVARSLPSISIHICQNNFSEPTSKAEIDDIVICHIDLDTANSLRSWINCNSISSSSWFVINALHVQDSEDGFKSLQSVLEVMVEVTKVKRLYIFLPLHCVSQRLSRHNANINFVQCVQSIQAEDNWVIINGSQSTSTTVVHQDIQKWLFGSYLYLVELKIEPGDVITVINNIAELNENKDLYVTRNDLSSDDYETICLECQHIQMGNSVIGLVVQPKTDLTNNCVEHLIDLMIQLINYEKTKGLSIQFIGVNNFVKSEDLLEYLFNKVKDIIEVNEINDIWIQLDDCGLDKKHCDIMYNFISQFKRLPNELWLHLRLNDFTVQDGNDLKNKLNDLFKGKSVIFYQ